MLTRAMQESNAPVATLGSALERMAAALAQWRQYDQRQAATQRGAVLSSTDAYEANAYRNSLERDFALCIESLQFHDRLVQRMCQVRRTLLDHVDAASAQAAATAAAAEHASHGSGHEGSIEFF